jgi:lipase maturation factor 1
MRWPAASRIGWLFDARQRPPDRLLPRWFFLRALGAIYFSAFYSLAFQIRGLIGPQGILPAQSYLHLVEQSLGHWERLWYAPTLLWLSSGAGMLNALCWAGMLASLLIVLNVWPRGMLALCFVLFSFLRECGAGFFGIPIRRHASGGGIHQLVFRAPRPAAGFRA